MHQLNVILKGSYASMAINGKWRLKANFKNEKGNVIDQIAKCLNDEKTDGR